MSARRTARSLRTRPAGIDRSPARNRSSAAAFPEPVTSHKMHRARSIAQLMELAGMMRWQAELVLPAVLQVL